MNDSTDRQAATPFGDALGQMTEGFTVPPWIRPYLTVSSPQYMSTYSNRLPLRLFP